MWIKDVQISKYADMQIKDVQMSKCANTRIRWHLHIKQSAHLYAAQTAFAHLHIK